MDVTRAQRLNRIFASALSDSSKLTNTDLFLESVCEQPDPVSCIHKIVTSKDGLKSFQKAMVRNLSLEFINGRATQVLSYLQSPELAEVGDGKFLRQVVMKIADPPIFWNEVLMAFKARHIEGTALKCFSWLLLQLVSLPSEEANSFRTEAGEDGIVDKILASTDLDTKSNGYKIQHILRTRNSDLSSNNRYSPGGRHDNDFEDFRQIALLPTADELLCKEPAFILTTDEQSRVPEEKLLATHLDNQFRLNREDLLYELREEVQVILGIKKGNHRGLVVNDLKLLDELYRKPDTKNCNLWGIQLKCDADFWFYRKEKLVHMNARKKFISDERNRRHLKHQSLVCLLVDGEIAAFPTINRDEDLLARKPPIIVLQLDKQSTTRALSMLFKGGDISVIQIDTAFFAHEHILKRLQEMTSLPLSHEILNWNQDSVLEEPSGAPLQIINALQTYPTQDLKPLLCLKRSIILDKAQSQSLLSGLKQRVSLIQGPPGTGKSFIGALIAKILHDTTSHTILVCCYTNHALDQFLEDLMDIGIPQSSIVRLGGKATARTEMLAISKQSRVSKFNRNDHRHLDMLRLNADGCFERLTNLYREAKTKNIPYSALLEYLEFEENQYYLAFQVPQDNLKDGMEVIGRRGKAVNSTYLLREWLNGNGPGIFKKRPNVIAAKEIWMRPLLFRKQELERWKINILKEDINNISEMAERYNSYQYQIGEKYLESDGAILRNKRIIGCTLQSTT